MPVFEAKYLIAFRLFVLLSYFYYTTHFILFISRQLVKKNEEEREWYECNDGRIIDDDE